MVIMVFKFTYLLVFLIIARDFLLFGCETDFAFAISFLKAMDYNVNNFFDIHTAKLNKS